MESLKTERRQRPNGTWTYTTPEWDATWYWPVGTKVRVLDSKRGIDLTGFVTKENAVSVRVAFDNGRTGLVQKTSDAQDRGEGLIRL